MLVNVLDREMLPLLNAIHQQDALTATDARLQFQFIVDLLQKEADDMSSVLRQCEALQALVDRYFSADHGEKFENSRATVSAQCRQNNPWDEGFLNEAILNCMPDRIAVITTDYRYLYTNPANAERLNERPMDLVGRHIVEFVGFRRFEQRVKPNLDRCFCGEMIDYTFAKDLNSHTVVVRCRMTPCKSNTGKIIGAILTLQEIADRRRMIAA